MRPSVRRLGRPRSRAVARRSRGDGQLHGWRTEWRVSRRDCDFEGADLQPWVDFGRWAGLPQEAFRRGISDIPEPEGVFLVKYLKEREDSVCQVKN